MANSQDKSPVSRAPAPTLEAAAAEYFAAVIRDGGLFKHEVYTTRAGRRCVRLTAGSGGATCVDPFLRVQGRYASPLAVHPCTPSNG